MGLYEILHWLPIEFRTKFKLLSIVFKTLQGNGHSYLQTKLNTITYQRTTRRSTTKGITLKAPFNKKKTYGDCGFTYTTASHWNMLPEYIRLTGDISTFKTVQNTLLQTSIQHLKHLQNSTSIDLYISYQHKNSFSLINLVKCHRW